MTINDLYDPSLDDLASFLYAPTLCFVTLGRRPSLRAEAPSGNLVRKLTTYVPEVVSAEPRDPTSGTAITAD